MVTTGQHERSRPGVWGMLRRLIRAAVGTVLIWLGLHRRSKTGVVAAAVGGAMLYRSVESEAAPPERREATVATAIAARPMSALTAARPRPVLAAPASAVSGARSVITSEAEPNAPAGTPASRMMRSVAAIGAVFGAAALASMPFGLIRLHSGDFSGDLRSPMLDIPLYHTTLDALWMFLSSIAGSGLALALLVGCIGALRFRAWARPVLLLWAWASIPIGIVGIFFDGRWLVSPARAQLGQVRGVVDSLANLGGWGAGSVLAIAMLVILMRQNVRAAFAERA